MTISGHSTKKTGFFQVTLLLLVLAGTALSVPVARAQGPNFTFPNATQATDAGTVSLFGTGTIPAGSGASASASANPTSQTPSGNAQDRSKPGSTQLSTSLPGVLSHDPPASSGASSALGGGTSYKGLNAFDSGQSNVIAGLGPLDVEPPDQGLCVGNGYALEAVNLAASVYSSANFSRLSTTVPLANLVGFPIAQQFGASSAGGGYILSDPRCLYDAGTGHWFMSFLYLGGNGTYSIGGPFPLGPHTYGAEFVLASQTTSPLGSWNVYMFNATGDALATNCPCFGDQPLLGADANTISISTNEYSVFASAAFFNGAQYYLLDKAAMAAGASSVNYAHFNMGLGLATPDGACNVAPSYFNCWYSVDPAVSPTTGSYDTKGGGIAWAMSSLDFLGNGDNRIAVWSFNDTSSITGAPKIWLYELLGDDMEPYYNPGFLVTQQSGPIPLGAVVYSDNASDSGGGCVKTCRVGGLASNGDGMWDTVTYAQGKLWGAINTVVNEGGSGHPVYYMGAAYWVVNAPYYVSTLASQGYVAAAAQNILFPSIAVGPTGDAAIVFTLSGHSYYPSSAYGVISSSSGGLIGPIHVTALGQSPQDGFSEYQLQGTPFYRPRWGDYTAAIWSNGSIYFSTEYIQSPNCSNPAFLSDPTCGGTRDAFANWGTSINVVSV